MSSRSTQIVGGPKREHAWVDSATNALLVKTVNPGGGGGDVNITKVGGVLIGITVPVSGTVSVGNFPATQAVTQSGAWTVTVQEPLSVDDNGGSLTVDGTVAVSNFPATQPVSGTVTAIQAIHDNLNLNANLQVANADVGSLNPVPISDNGGSLTVDGTVAISGTVAVTQSGAWTVTVQEPLSVDDNGGSLTVDGTVAVTQATHDNLNLNANLQVGNADVTTINPVPVSDAGGSLTVDGTVAVSGTVAVTQSGAWTVSVSSLAGNVKVVQSLHDSLQANANLQVGNVDVTNANPVPVSDAGGSLTVDGSISVSNFPAVYPVNDNGGSLTIDGTVAVSSIVPGTGATNLGKVEDAAHVTGDVGVMALAVRNDAGGALAGLTGDYIPLTTDAFGRLRTFSFIGDGAHGTTNLLGVYATADAFTTKGQGIAPFFEVSTAPVVSGEGTWAHGYISTTGGILVSLVEASAVVNTLVIGVTPGTGATNLGKTEDAAHATGHVGVMALAVRQDSLAALAGTTADYIPLTTDSLGRLNITKQGGKATYRACTTVNVVAAASAAMFFVITGSATKTLIVQRIRLFGPTLTLAEYNSIVAEKWSTAPTGGTATAFTQVPVDSGSAPGTATLCQVYTAAPTEGTLVGTIGCLRFMLQAPATVTGLLGLEWDFRNLGESSGTYLRGTAQALSLAFGAAPASAVTLSVEVEWTEE